MMNSRQSGLTLVELLISVSLGLIISLFITNIMISSARTATTSEGISQAQETGRLTMSWLDRYLSRAGYNSNYLSNESVTFSPLAEACTGASTPPSNNAHCSFNTDSNTAGGDRIAIRRKAGGLTPADMDLKTCTDENLPANITNNQEEVIDVFWVDDEQLRCVTYNQNGNKIGNAQSIANGVESMHFLVGIGDNDGNVQRFVSLSNVSNWNDVVAIRVAILTKEFGSNSLELDDRVYGLLDSTPITYKDTLSRYVQNGTIWFPNTKFIDR